MFDLGFEPQVMRILLNIRPDRQLVLFSATFPRQMESLARKVLTKPVEIVVGGRSAVPEQITQLVEVRTEDSKFLRLLEILGKWYSDESHEDDRTLIFVESQNSADKLLSDLMRKAYPALSLHGGKDQVKLIVPTVPLNILKSYRLIALLQLLISKLVASQSWFQPQYRHVVSSKHHLKV